MIKGNTVYLRAVEKTDLALLRDWRNIEHFRKNFREYRELSMANQEDWFSRVYGSKNDFMFLIVRKEDDMPLGVCGLLYIDWIIRSADYSFYIGFDELYIDDKGYAKEASELLIQYGFDVLNLNKIWMELYEFDKKKIDFFTGQFPFKIDGTLRQNCFYQGQYYNSLIISLLRNEYKNEQ